VIDDIVKCMVPLVKKYEGLHRVVSGQVFPYICPAGYPTQGYGLLVKDMSVPPISVEEAEVRMLGVLPGYILDTLKICPTLWTCPPEVVAAISDFTFNLGASRLRASTLRRKINEGLWDEIPAELNKWVYGGGRKLPGLVARRATESAIVEAYGRTL
jgi:lysozyme